jgi:ParB family chromosome partitioning protein
MSVRRGGLGRGLGALIPTSGTGYSGSTEESHSGATERDGGIDIRDGAPPTTLGSIGARFAEIPLAAIRPNARQPRQIFDESALAELAFSLKEVGFLQPIVVREIAREIRDRPQFELVMGERRWRAAQLAGIATVPAIVRETDDDAMLRDALLENLHREQLNPLEEGAAYAQLLEEFGVTHDQLAQRIGRSRSQVTNTMRLLNLPAAVQRRVAAGVLSAGHARALLSLADPEEQDKLAQRIVAEGLSVRAVEEIVAVGVGSGTTTTRRVKAPSAAGLDELAATLSDHFETRVRVELGRSRGKITIEFASIEDLDRIVTAIGPAGLSHQG